MPVSGGDPVRIIIALPAPISPGFVAGWRRGSGCGTLRHQLRSNGGDLFLADRDGSNPHKLVSLKDFLYGPQVSLDGKRIRFTVRELNTGARSLWEVTAQGTHLHPLLPGWQNPATAAEGKWTSDGKYFVFQSQGQVWAVPDNAGLFGRTDGKPIRLTTSPLTLASPLPSKDGNKLFVVGRAQRGILSRYEPNVGQFLPYLSGPSAETITFSRERSMDRVCQLPRRHFVAQQTRRNRAAASHRSATLSAESALVA